VRVGDTICARSFQAAVGCVDAQKGVTLWSKNIGGTDAVAADADYVFAGDASDRITAWKANGDAAWSTDKLLYRTLSAPLSVGKTVVFGDEDGTLHFLARETGDALLRLTTDGSAIVAQPVVSGTVMLVVTRKGGLFAFRPQ
jgi:outer membrane protein assembly factor BamB